VRPIVIAVDHVDVLIVGAGVVGLAIAERLSRKDREIVVVERHDGFGRETSSRNSEVIHAGLYYEESLLKTRLCVRGNPLLYELCAKQDIPHRKTGKMIVAVDEGELEELQAIMAQATSNGVSGLRLLAGREIEMLEPEVFGVAALYSPESGIVDSHRLMSYLERTAAGRGATIAYSCRVTGLQKSSNGYAATILDADGEPLEIETTVLINSAGLWADTVAEMAGIDAAKAGYRIYPCKGEYFAISSRHHGKLGMLVYPVPSPIHLGAHAVLALDDRLKIGPSAVYVDQIQYDVDPSHRGEFFQKARRFLPFLEEEDLTPDMSGIRPKLYRLGEPFRDFVIREESDRGLDGLINLVGIESPGLTSCLAIAEMVEGLL
jgi:L-2-hydroxyglutarate oxidase LhgO